MAHTDEVRRYPFSQDWRIWAEIQYLDSPTDYREYLVQPTHTHRDHSEELLFLSEARRNLRNKYSAYPQLIMIALLFLGAGYLLWWIVLDKL
jgi:hypothetical protein